MKHTNTTLRGVLLIAAVLTISSLPAQEPPREQPLRAVIIEDKGVLGNEGAIAVVLVEVSESLKKSGTDAFRKGARLVVNITAETKLERVIDTKRSAARPADLKKGCQVEMRGIGEVLLSDPAIIAPRGVLVVDGPKIDSDKKERPTAEGDAGKKSARELLNDAMTAAKKDNKNVFLVIGGLGCNFTVFLDAYHNDPVVRKILSPHYVFVRIEWYQVPGGRELWEKYAGKKMRLPVWVILDPAGKTLAISGANLEAGYPSTAADFTHYKRSLELGSPKLSAPEIDTLRKKLREHGPNKFEDARSFFGILRVDDSAALSAAPLTTD
ncbi:MAG: thioredoxin family protein [Gemmataceae bacterium]